MIRRRDWCKHYNGFGCSEVCKAGVNYVQLNGGTKDKMMLRLPCLPGDGRGADGVKCDKFELRTPEEIAAEEQEFKARLERFGRCRAAIVAHLGGPWKKGTPGASGVIDCPSCEGGKLHFSRAGYNGHIHAHCTTPGCASWME